METHSAVLVITLDTNSLVSLLANSTEQLSAGLKHSISGLLLLLHTGLYYSLVLI